MKSLDFLRKLKKEDKLTLVEGSEQISLSYERKGVECRQVARLAFDNGYVESAITQSYYSMYNTLLGLFFKCGIKCENHTAAAILLKEYFLQEKLSALFLKAKMERIDKQYYVTSPEHIILTTETAKEMMGVASIFNPEITAFKINLTREEIDKIRKRIGDIE